MRPWTSSTSSRSTSGTRRTTARASATGAIAAGKQLGAQLLGGSLYELPPGERTWPYHYEEGCEEWVLAVSGRPTLRGPDGERELEPGRPRRLRRGAGGRAQVINKTDEPCRVLILSSKAPIAVVHYPESGKVGIWTQAGGGYQTLLRRRCNRRLLGGGS